METLASIWKAIDDSNVLWMFEAAWPLIQFLGVLLAVCAVGLVWLWLAHTFGDDDDFEDEEEEIPVLGLTPEQEKINEEMIEDHKAAIILDMYPDASKDQFFRDELLRS